jgi:hypothetical protein
MLRLIDRFRPDFVAGDLEQWWADWAKWRLYAVHKKIPMSEVPKLSASRINTVSKTWFEVVSKEFPKTLVYTSTGFISTWCMQALQWIGNYDLWLAQYPPRPPITKMTWATLKAQYLPKTRPSVLKGMRQPLIWQWTGDRLWPEGNNKPVDVNWWMQGTIQEYVGSEAPPPVPKPYREAVLKDGIKGLNVRAFPWRTGVVPGIIRAIQPSETIRIDLEKQELPWVRLYGEPGWINSNFVV